MATTTGQITITDLNDGYTLVITGGNRSFSYTGTTPSPSTSGTFSYTLYRGGISLTPSTFSWTAAGVFSGTGSAATFQPTLSTTYTVATPTTVTLQVTHQGNTITATQAILVSQAPSNAVIHTIYVSAPAIYKDAADAATTGTYTSVTIQGRKTDGATTTNFGWITTTPNNGTESARTNTATTALTLSPTTTSGVSSYTIKLYSAATGGTLLTSQTISVTFKGAAGSPGSSPVLYELGVSSGVVVRNYNNTLTPSGVTVSGFSTTAGTKSSYSGRFKIYEDGIVKYTSTANQASYTYTPTTSSVGILKFELYLAGGTATLLDTQEVPVVVAGSSAMTFSVTNSTYPIPASNNGAVVSYADSGTNIQVLEGDEPFTYVSNLGNNSLTINTVARNSSNVATVTTTTPHGLTSGNTVTVNCTSNNTFNTVNTAVTVINTTTFTYANTGTTITSVAATGSVFTNTNKRTITSVSRNSTNVATVNVSAAHGLATGDLVNITCSDATFVANNVPVTVIDTDTFTYSSTGNAVATVSVVGLVQILVGKKLFTIGTPTLSVANAITVGARSGLNTTTAVVAAHSLMSNSVDAVVINYPITYIRANGALGAQILTQAITKVKAGTLGIRGSRTLYSTDAAYVSGYDFDGGGAIAAGAASYAAKATALIAAATAGTNPTTPINGDTVTFTNGTNYTYTITHNGTTWAPPGTVIDGSLLVTGSVATTALSAGTINVGLNITSTDGLFRIDFANKFISISV